MRIAVVGATGLLGQHTARALLEQGHSLTVIHRSTSNLERLSGLAFQSLEADLNDRGALAAALGQVDAAIHCAGYYPTVPVPWRQDVLTARRQMENFCAAALANRIQKVVYVSAASVLPRNPCGEASDESLRYDREPADRTPFLQVKWAMEQVAHHYLQRGLSLVVAIPSMAFGEYDHGPTAGRLIVGIADGSLRGYVDGKRNVLYAGDVGRGLLRCLEAGRVGERYLLVGENITMDALVEKIARIAGTPPPRRYPTAVARLWAEGQALRFRMGGPEPTVTPSAIRILARGQYLQGTKAERELGFKAGVSIEEAIDRALSWFRQVGTLPPQGPMRGRTA